MSKILRILLALLLIVVSFPSFLVHSVQAKEKSPQIGNPVIFIPGATGTELFLKKVHPDNMIWPLALGNTSYSDLDSDNVVHGLPLGWSGSYFGYYGSRLAVYKNTESFLEKEKYRYYAFPYDWRLSNEDNATKLSAYVGTVLNLDVNKGYDKVDIIAHSMGGLLAKKYIIDTEGEKVDQFISVGTPYFGAPKAFLALKDGARVMLPKPFQQLIKEGTLRSEFRSLQAVFELLPNKAYFNNNDTVYVADITTEYDEEKDLVTATDHEAWNFSDTQGHIIDQFEHVDDEDDSKAEKAQSFHDYLNKYASNYVFFYRFIGDARNTLGFVFRETRYDTDGDKLSKFWWTAGISGDSTVPVAGAAYGDVDTYYYSEDHVGLMTNKYILNGIDRILSGENPVINRKGLRKQPEENDDRQIIIYNADNDTFDDLYEPASLKKSLNTNTTSVKEFNPKITLKYPDGSSFVYANNEVISDPHDIEVRNLGTTIELVVEKDDFDFTIEQNINNTLIGMRLLNYGNGSITDAIDYEHIDISQGNLIGTLSSSLSSSQLGVDTNRDGVIDNQLNGIAVEPINHPLKQYDYDSDPTQSFPDPEDPGEDPGDGSVTLDISGTDGNNDWKTSGVNITINTTAQLPAENNDSNLDPNAGIETPELSYKIDDGPESGYSGAINYSEDGKHLIAAYAKDKDGNILGQASKTFKIDQTNPELQTQVAGVRGENGWIISDAQVSIGASDETSKLARVDIDLDGSGYDSYEAPIDVKEEGLHTVAAEAEDNAGHTESDSASFKIDKTKPVISNVFLQDEYYWDQDFPIQFNVSDKISGVDTVQATINGKPVSNDSMYHFTEPGWHTYRIEVKDQAGWNAVYETKFEVYIPAKITFEPGNLQLDHGSGMATNHIELPVPFEPEKINFSTVQTNEKVVHVQDPQYGYVENPISDSDDNGITDMMLKYERESLVNVIAPKETGSKWSNGDLTMFGEWGTYHFKGYDHIQVLNSGYTPPPPDVTPPVESSVPANGANNVSVDVTPVITFSEQVILKGREGLTDDEAQGIIELKHSSGQSIPFTANWMNNTLSFQINPTNQLEGMATYILSVKPDTVTDSVYNSNEPLTVSFKTENHPIVIESPLPVPQIEEDDESGYPTPDPVPTPTPTPGPTTPSGGTPSEQQAELNQQASSVILSAGDSATILREVENTFDRINSFTDSKDQSITDKLNVIDNTVTTVMTAVVEKMDLGTVKQSDVKKYIQMLLEDTMDKVMGSLEIGNKDDLDQAVRVLSQFNKKIFSHVDNLDDLSDNVADLINNLLLKGNTLSAQNDSIISDIQDTIEEVSAHISTLEESLGGYVKKVEINKQIRINVETNSDANLQITTEALDSIKSSDMHLSIMTESHAGMELPPGLLKQITDKTLEVSIVKVGKGKKMSLANSSDEYEMLLKSGDEFISQFGHDEVKVSIPMNSRMYHPQALYYDKKKKSWLSVKSSDGEITDVEKMDGVAYFKTPHFTKFKLSDSPISKITVEPSRKQLEPGTEIQLKVTAIVNKKRVDITAVDSGTIYTSSKPDVVSVDENGLVKVSNEAEEGKKVTITAKNAGKSSKASITIGFKKVVSLAVTPKKISLEPGTSNPLTVTAKMSDGSTNDRTAVSLGTTYKSSNEDIATVDENGIVTIKEEAGEGAKVTITVSNSKKTAQCTIIVK